MADLFVIAHNPDPQSRLPFLLRLPVEGEAEVVLATRGTWPSGKDLFCYPLDSWPEGAQVVETVPVERCWRAGAAVHLVLERRRARRSLFVWTRSRGRTLIFWRSRTSMRGARPGVRIPQARGLERALEVAVDTRERHPWRFVRYGVRTERRELPVGDYAVLDGGRCVAAVERKTVADLASSATGGELDLVLAELDRLPHGALVVEGRLSDLLKVGQEANVRPGWLLNLVAALQVSHPRVAWMFAESRSLAEDFAYRWLAASAHAERLAGGGPPAAVAELPASYPGPRLLDAQERRRIALQEAAAGVVWTAADFAARCGVRPATAWRDLKALVDEGRLVAEGGRRTRRYRAPSGAGRPAGRPPGAGSGQAG
ncbi:MAG: ERCC4 domain-containing protein [Bacillota bacterium]|nr:ERCC4 domain-containing protein [Bacillota bacterium]